MKKLYKIGAVAAAIIVLLICTGLGIGYEGDRAEPYIAGCADDLEGQVLGGIVTRMPQNSSQIYFESLLGRKLGGYTTFGSYDEAVTALKMGKCSALWSTDVSAKYLTSVYEGLEILDNKDMAATAQLSQNRFGFSMALRDDAEGKRIRTKINDAMNEMVSDGTLAVISKDYITRADRAERFYEEEMWHRNERYLKNHELTETITIGVTGAVPPIELIDESGKPYGFCVVFLDEIACRAEVEIDIEILDNETAFSSLMSGRVDALMTYGNAHNTTETMKDYITTDAFYAMNNYKFIVNSEPDSAN